MERIKELIPIKDMREQLEALNLMERIKRIERAMNISSSKLGDDANNINEKGKRLVATIKEESENISKALRVFGDEIATQMGATADEIIDVTDEMDAMINKLNIPLDKLGHHGAKIRDLTKNLFTWGYLPGHIFAVISYAFLRGDSVTAIFREGFRDIKEEFNDLGNATRKMGNNLNTTAINLDNQIKASLDRINNAIVDFLSSFSMLGENLSANMKL